MALYLLPPLELELLDEDLEDLEEDELLREVPPLYERPDREGV